jgi:hypothetical protein
MNRLPLILVLFFGAITFFGCQKKWTEPEFNAENWVQPPGLTDQQFYTIGSTKVVKKHTLGNPPDSIVNPKDKYLRFIKAVVVSSDEGGNYYKSMVIQDETGGVELELDANGLYNSYPVGQKIVLVCNGLVVGDYNYLPQIGWIYNGTQVGRINSLFFDKYIIKDGAPSLKNIPKALTNDEIEFAPTLTEINTKDVNKLVRLEGVRFEKEAFGKPLSYNDFTTDWKIFVPLANGNKQEVFVRTSNYAKFRSMIIEDKEYNLTGILTYFRSTTKSPYQLMIRTKEDIQVVTNSVVFDFSSNPFSEGMWSCFSRLGTNTQWGYRTTTAAVLHPGNLSGDYHTAMDDWFISPVINFPDFAKGYLHFEHQIPVLNGQYDAYQVFYTTTNSTTFNLTDWKELGEISSFPNSFEWSNKLPISKINADSFRIAFRYNAPDPNIETYAWSIKRVEIRNK